MEPPDIDELDAGWYEICPVCDGDEEVQVGTDYTMPCPACVLGLVPHECPDGDV